MSLDNPWQPQVMSRPNDSYARSERGVTSRQVVNGVDPPLRGHLDLDDEVTTQRVDMELGAGGSTRQRSSVDEPPASAGDFLQGPSAATRVAGDRTSSQGGRPAGTEGGPGVPPGVVGALK